MLILISYPYRVNILVFSPFHNILFLSKKKEEGDNVTTMRQVTYQISFQGESIPCYITFKRVKNISFRMDREGKFMKVSCPTRVKESYLVEQINRVFPKLYQKVDHSSPINGDTLYLFGEQKEVEGFSILDEKKKRKYLANLLLKYCEERVRFYESVMGIKEPYKVKVRAMKSRYGVNNRNNHSVTFALSLVHFSPDIIDSVIVHELAHHYVFNHSKAFYDIVLKYDPDYKIQHGNLRKNNYK